MKTQLLNPPKQKNLIHDRFGSLLGLNFSPSETRSKAYFNAPPYFSQDERLRIVIEGQSGDQSIKELCARKGITTGDFFQWTREFLSPKDVRVSDQIPATLADDDRFRIVLEASNGEYSVAEICRREAISHETFLNWSREFLKAKRRSLLPRGHSSNLDSANYFLREFVSASVLDFFECYVDLYLDRICISTDPDHTLRNWNASAYEKMICLYKMNDIRHINKHFEALNEQMQVGDTLIGCMETFSARKNRMWINKVPLVNNLYFGMEFFLKRMLPKINGTKEIYFNVTKGKDRLLSKAEALGRLVSCGFRIIDHFSIEGLVYFVIQKEKQPSYDMNPSYGPIYAMPRLGKNGKIIKVYKLRTMHPYSEYLQDYIVRANGYAESGKPADDFRIPAWGKVMRRFWLDELPQIFNFLKGELKLVGIRPVSERYFQDIPKEMQKLRLTQKPGCIPPYVSLNRAGNVMSVLQAEKEYLEEKINHPYTTDSKYFFKALFNIIFRHKRSA